ncbi:hypothetical protein NCCP2495_34270 [Dietzia sp. NCCP-2495]|nr:hypothetical protein NCCP2495_34270 [Dietzia sp. NCCP-2495]
MELRPDALVSFGVVFNPVRTHVVDHTLVELASTGVTPGAIGEPRTIPSLGDDPRDDIVIVER